MHEYSETSGAFHCKLRQSYQVDKRWNCEILLAHLFPWEGHVMRDALVLSLCHFQVRYVAFSLLLCRLLHLRSPLGILEEPNTLKQLLSASVRRNIPQYPRCAGECSVH